MRTGLKFRCYPNKRQEQVLLSEFGCAKFVYNWALNLKEQVFKGTAEYTPNEEGKLKYVPKSGKTVSYNELAKLLTDRRNCVDWLGNGSRYVQAQALRKLESAYSNHFKNPSHFGTPNYKNKYSDKTCTYQVDQSTKINDSTVRVNKALGDIKYQGAKRYKTQYFKKHDKELVFAPKLITFSLDKCGDWWMSWSQEQDFEIYELSDDYIAFDMGVKTNAVKSDGTEIKIAAKIKKKAKFLRRYQRQASRSESDSNRKKKKQNRVNKCYRYIANAIDDMHHKESTESVRRYQFIVVEDLNLTGMVKNHKLANSIMFQKWGGFFNKLTYKSARHGRQLIKVPRFFPSSKLCSNCGYKNKELRLKDRSWLCPICGINHDRDVNASLNIQWYGRYMQEILRDQSLAELDGNLVLLPAGSGKITDVDLYNYHSWKFSCGQGTDKFFRRSVNHSFLSSKYGVC